MKVIGSGILTQRKIRQSDVSAFEVLFREYYAPLCRFASRFVHDMDTAEEIVQEFFYNYWKNRTTIEIKVSIKAYLYSAIRNQSLKTIEQQKVRHNYINSKLNSDEVFVELNQLDELQVKEMEQIIDQTLAGLPERCRLIFSMSRHEGKKYQEIASALGISIKTVEANMGKALQQLRNTLSNYQNEPLQKS
jgi:RNA polymerase sigma-70 factor, ECF subfamily